jgi:hypothetical protein
MSYRNAISDEDERMNNYRKKPCILFIEPKLKDLNTRSRVELQALCLALNIPYSATKANLIVRILWTWDLRTILKDFNAPQELAEAFKGRELIEMCKTARCWRGGTKYGKAAALLNWRNECRQKGQQRVNEALKERYRKLLLCYWGPM